MRAADTDLLCCPACRGVLDIGADSATCTGCGTSFGIEKGVPVLVIGEGAVDRPRAARKTLHSAASNPAIYDLIQRAAGRERIKRRIAPVLANTAGATVLDVGGGTGSLRALLDPGARYVWLDSDLQKLDGFAAASPNGEVVLSNALRMAVKDVSADTALCSALSHHLDDDGLAELVDELHRVVRDRVFFLDAVRTRAPIGSILWQLDRGAYPRTDEELLTAFGRRFDVVETTRFTVLHRYLFAVLRRRDDA